MRVKGSGMRLVLIKGWGLIQASLKKGPPVRSRRIQST